MKLEWRILTDDEAAERDAVLRAHRAREGVQGAWHALAVHLCDKGQGGHLWYLHIDPDDGVWLTCRRCRAGVDDLYPDGIGMLTGEFEVFPGYVLGLRAGGVQVNGQESYGLFTYGWRGPVIVGLHVEKYTSMDWIGTEYDAWIEVEKRDA